MTDAVDSAVAAVARIAVIPTILDVVCRTTGMRFATIARVTEDRWIACAVQDKIGFGLQAGGELKVETTICHEVRDRRQPIIINDASQDPVYKDHPTPRMYNFKSYISMPIIHPNGEFFGTLCGLDPRPAKLNEPEVIGMFRLFAELIAFHLDATEQVAASGASLSDERQIAALREQFVAVLGHDLRNPLAAIDAGVQLIARTPLNEKATHLIGLMRGSVTRIADLIDNILDFAQGRLGGGLKVERQADTRLQLVLTQIVAELQTTAPDRIFEVEFNLAAPVRCDPGRIGQLFSNLLGNAVSHGASGMPIRTTAATREDCFELSVCNAGEPIPAAAIERLFQPFTRGRVNPTQQGLGLGLYICAEIAKAHDGHLNVVSTDEQTCFTFRMPLT